MLPADRAMPPRPQRTSARLLAPVALVACALAVLIIIAGSGGTDESNGDAAPPQTADQTDMRTTTTSQPRESSAYTIKPGDTLGGIAEETGVPVETIEILNPELDPQALIAGQKIKLRE